MLFNKILPFLILCLWCPNVLAACNLSSWAFNGYQGIVIGDATIQNGALPAGGSITEGGSSQLTDSYNLTTTWINAGSGDIHTSQPGTNTTYSFRGSPSNFTAPGSSCSIQVKPIVDSTPRTVNQPWYYQYQFAYGAEFIIPANCPIGTYEGVVNIEAHIVDPVNCPEGGTVVSAFSGKIIIHTVESGGAAVFLNNREDLSFGSFLSPQVAGQVEVSATSDTPTYTSIFKVDSSSAHRGQMEVTGTPGTQYSLMMPQTEISLHSGGNSLRLSNMTMLNQNTGQVGTQYQNISIGGAGTDIIYVGGRLEVPARAEAGEYIGTYTVQLTY